MRTSLEYTFTVIPNDHFLLFKLNMYGVMDYSNVINWLIKGKITSSSNILTKNNEQIKCLFIVIVM